MRRCTDSNPDADCVGRGVQEGGMIGTPAAGKSSSIARTMPPATKTRPRARYGHRGMIEEPINQLEKQGR